MSSLNKSSIEGGTRNNKQPGLGIKVVVSAIAVGLGIVNAISDLKLDVVSLGLFVLAMLPWLLGFVQSAKLPGGIELIFRELSDRQKSQEENIKAQREDIDAQTERIEAQRRIIDTQRLLVQHLISRYEVAHLRKLEARQPYQIKRFKDQALQEIRNLEGKGLIERQKGKGFTGLLRDGGDVNTYFKISGSGREYLRLLDKAEIPMTPGQGLDGED